MGQLKLGVDIEFRKTGDGVEVAVGAVEKLNEKARQTTGAFGGLAGSIGTAISAFAGFAALKSALQAGIQFNAAMESSRLSIAALAVSFGQLRDGAGVPVARANQLGAALEVATELQEDLKVAALQTTAEYEDMIRALQEGVGPALKAGFDTGQIVEFTKLVTQAAGAIGLPMQQLGQEVRSLFAGDIGPDARLANLLFSDIPRDKIKAYVRELQASGKFFDEMKERMFGFAAAGERASATFAGATSNLKDAISQTLGAGTQQAFERLTPLIQEVTSWFVTFDAQGKATFNQDFVNRISVVADAVVNLAEVIVGLAKTVGPPLSKLADLIFSTLGVVLNKLGEWWYAAAGKMIGAITSVNDYMLKFGATIVENFPDLSDALGLDQFVASFATGNEELKNFAAFLGDDLAAAHRESAGRAADAFWNAWDDRAEDGKKRARSKFNLFGPDGLANEADAERLKKITAAMKEFGAAMRQIQNDARGRSEDFAFAKSLAEAASEFDRIDIGRQRKIAEAYRKQVDQEKAVQDQLAKLRESGISEWSTQYLRATAEAYRAHKDIAQATADEIAAIEAEAARQTEDELTRQWDAAAEAQMHAIEESMANVNRAYDNVFGTLTGSFRTAWADALSGDNLSGAFDTLLEGFRATWTEFVGGMIDDFVAGWVGVAQGQPMPGQTGPPSPGQQRFAQGAVAVIGGGAALADMWRGGNTRGQNVMTGLTTGASIGSMFSPVVGTIVGAVLGAVIGALAPTKEKAGYNISVVGGRVSVRGVGDAKDREVQAAIQQINAAVSEARANIQEILDILPASIFEGIAGFSVTPPVITKLIEAVSSAQSALAHFIAVTVPEAFLNAALPAFAEVAEMLGVTDDRWQQIVGQLRGMDPTKATKMLRDYFAALIGMIEAQEFLQKSMADKVGLATEKKTGAEQLNVFNDRVERMTVGFDALTGEEEQIKRAQQIIALLEDRHALELQIIADIKAAWEDVNKSIEQQIFDVQQSARNPEDQLSALQDRQAALRDRLLAAKTPEEVAQIVAEMQQNLSQIYALQQQIANAYKALVEAFKGVVAEIESVAGFVGMDLPGKIEKALSMASESGLDKLDELNDSIAKLFDGFDKPEEQVARAREISALLQDRYQLELALIQHVKAALDSTLKSIDDQIFDMQQSTRTPQEQIDALLERQRVLREMLAGARTPEEIQRIVAEMQGNVTTLYGLMGNTPEAAAELITMLQDIRELADAQFQQILDGIQESDDRLRELLDEILGSLRDGLADLINNPPALQDQASAAQALVDALNEIKELAAARFQEMLDNIQESDDALLAMVEEILGKLRDGIGTIFNPPTTGDDDGNNDDGNDWQDPRVVDLLSGFGTLNTRVSETGAVVDGFAAATAAGATTLEAFAAAAGAAASALAGFGSSTGKVNVTVNVNGSMAAVVSEVEAVVGPTVVNQALVAVDRELARVGGGL
jgi:hypothetical protein